MHFRLFQNSHNCTWNVVKNPVWHLGIRYITQSANTLTVYNVSIYNHALIHVFNCCWAGLSEQLRVQGRLEPPTQESGTVSNQYTLLVLVHDAKTRVASNHKMKCDTNIVWNASRGNIAKPGLTCAWASACCCAKWGARKMSDACAMTEFTGTKSIDHWNVSSVGDFHILSTLPLKKTSKQPLST